MNITPNAQKYIDLEDRYGAHNYHPLPVVLTKGEGPFLWDVDGKRYFDPDSGRMCTGWLDLGGRRYLMNNGIMATGWLNIDGIDYYFDKDGNVCIGKTYSEGDSAFYYLFPDGGYARKGT